jgi:hypothetical protein
MKSQFGTSIYLWTFLVSHTVCNFTTNNVELEKDTNIRLIKYYGSEMATSALHWKPSDVIAVIYIFVDFVISKNIFNCDKNSIKSVWIAHRLGSFSSAFYSPYFSNNNWLKSIQFRNNNYFEMMGTCTINEGNDYSQKIFCLFLNG